MKVFLTGGTGFVGSHVVEALLREGHEVVALVRKTSDTELLNQWGVKKVVGALGDARGLMDHLTEADAVVHVAGLVAASRPEVMYQANVEGTRDLVDRVAELGDPGKRFIYISSVAAQGPSRGREPRPVTEMPQPVSFYGRTKLEGEGAVLAHRDNMEVTILRPPPVYGPRDRDMFQVFAIANRRLSPVLGMGNRWLSIIHVDDVARAVVACVEAPGKGRVYPIDDGGVYTWRDLGEQVSEALEKSTLTVPLPAFLFAGAATISELGGRLLGSPPTFSRDKYREMIQSSWVCGHRGLHEDLGWEPSLDLREGACRTAQWYRENGWL